jgi:hypothetical protein
MCQGWDLRAPRTDDRCVQSLILASRITYCLVFKLPSIAYGESEKLCISIKSYRPHIYSTGSLTAQSHTA